MSESASRLALHAYVSSSAHERWHAFAADSGVSVSALLEAIGLGLASSISAASCVDAAPLVADARRIDAERRRRRTADA